LDINALITFLEVAKTHHFGHAAENLFVSQSTVSARIRSLEESFGTELFVRDRGNIHLSKSGEALVSHAKSIMTLWGRARQEVAMPEGLQDTLIIGGLSGLWDITLQNWLSNISEEWPTLAITANAYNANTLVKRIMNGSIDVAFLYDVPQSLNLISQPLTTIQLRMVSSKRVTNVDAALAQGFVSVDWGLNFAVKFEAAFPDVRSAKLSTGLGRIAFEYLKRNEGSAYLAEPTVAQAIKKNELFYVPKSPIFNRQAYAIYQQDNDKTDLIQSLISTL